MERRWPKCEEKKRKLTKLVFKKVLNVQEIIGREELPKRRKQVCDLAVVCRRWEVGTESEKGVLVDVTQ